MRIRNPKEKKLRIIEAATALFVKKGYFPTTLAQIAAQAQCSKSMISQHFGSKGELASIILQEHRLELAEDLRQASDPFDSEEDRVRVEVRTFIVWCLENPNKALYLYSLRHSEYLEGEEPGPEPIMDLVRDQVRHGQEQGEVRSGSPFILGLAYTAPIVMLVRFVLEGRVRYDLLKLVDTLSDLAWSTIKIQEDTFSANSALDEGVSASTRKGGETR